MQYGWLVSGRRTSGDAPKKMSGTKGYSRQLLVADRHGVEAIGDNTEGCLSRRRQPRVELNHGRGARRLRHNDA
jgi:hypothetical protein